MSDRIRYTAVASFGFISIHILYWLPDVTTAPAESKKHNIKCATTGLQYIAFECELTQRKGEGMLSIERPAADEFEGEQVLCLFVSPLSLSLSLL